MKILILVCLFSCGLQAAPVEPFFVRYRSVPELAPLTMAAFKQSLMSATLIQQARVFGDDRSIRVSSLWIAGGSLAFLTRDQAARVARNEEVLSVTKLNRKAHLTSLNTSYVYGLEKIKIPEVNARNPTLTGEGVSVGVIDTGINDRHPDLKGKVLAFKDFIRSTGTTPYDDHGHGTHVAGTISARRASGPLIGVAPNSHLVIAKAFSKYGGTSEQALLHRD